MSVPQSLNEPLPPPPPSPPCPVAHETRWKKPSSRCSDHLQLKMAVNGVPGIVDEGKQTSSVVADPRTRQIVDYADVSLVENDKAGDGGYDDNNTAEAGEKDIEKKQLV